MRPASFADQQTKRETGAVAQSANIGAAKVSNRRGETFPPVDLAICPPLEFSVGSRRDTRGHNLTGRVTQAVSDIVRTTLGPRSMLKMLLDPMGGIGARFQQLPASRFSLSPAAQPASYFACRLSLACEI